MNKAYIHTEDIHNFNAPKQMVPRLVQLIKPKSVLDVGCGIGTWLKIFEEYGVKDYLGIDGEYVNRSLLKIPNERFYPQDLQKEWNLNRKFDLVISLEVAEHIRKEDARHFVQMLVAHGDVILFSAAIPGQGGQHHVNEQWLSYWLSLFREFDYQAYDVIRPDVWNNALVEVWYKQNSIVFCKCGHPSEQRLREHSSPYVDVVHPDLFAFYFNQAERAALYEQGKLGIYTAFVALWKSIVNKFR